ncbi:MAG: glutamate-5-semialdehyde dehydrogenase [Candidatus Makaraimicrobium thalassicum]|nr:MAG: glutamate-5-semialdehyde dehydrogenase [Candidatus Omnitrophota bacterium]
MDSSAVIREITGRAREAAAVLSVMPSDKKNGILLAMAEGLDRARGSIEAANELDVANAEKKGKGRAFVDRLKLDGRRIDGMCAMMRTVAGLKDPVGDVLEKRTRPNGLIIEKVRVPIGVIGIIYESRPNVTADCISLCFKSGNALILRGGSDAINSNKAIYEAAKNAAGAQGMDKDAFILIKDTSRELVDAMLEASEGIDLIMPRGGESLIREVAARSRVPVIKHYKGICHVYVDAEADMGMAEDICFNAKVQRPGVCNAMETMLVHEAIAEEFLPRIAARLRGKGVTLKGCPETRHILGDEVDVAGEKDFATEWLDLVLNIRVVRSLEEAVAHIAKFGSNHSDAIVTENRANGIEFTQRVDSAAVYINASPRFTDGGEFGKGAEIGISTDKLHARGPMGLEELTTYKYVIHGSGQVRT